MQYIHAPARPYVEDAVAVYRRLGDPYGLAYALTRLGGLLRDLINTADYPAARAALEESVSIAQTLHDPVLLANANWHLACLDIRDTAWSQARARLQESLRLYDSAGDARGRVLALRELGYVAMAEGDYPRARDFLEQSLNLASELGHRYTRSQGLEELGFVLLALGQAEEARETLAACLEDAREIGRLGAVPRILQGLGEAAYALGDVIQFAARYDESLDLASARRSRHAVGRALVFLLRLAVVDGDDHAAARLHGAIESIRAEVGPGALETNLQKYELDVAGLRQRLDPDTFARAVGDGQALTLDQVVDAGRRAVDGQRARAST
jgi:tetratricopeptide (TPR) repeat protein